MIVKKIGNINQLTPENEEKNQSIDTLKNEWEAKIKEQVDEIRGMMGGVEDNGNIDVKSLTQLNRRIKDIEKEQIPGLENNWDKTAPEPVKEAILKIQNDYKDDQAVAELKKYYIGLRELVLSVAKSQRDKLANETRKIVIDGRISTETKRWENDKLHKFKEIEEMMVKNNFNGLINSKADHLEKIKDAELAFKSLSNDNVTKTVRERLLKLIINMKASGMNEAEIENIKNGYLESLHEIVNKIDEALLNKPANTGVDTQMMVVSWEDSLEKFIEEIEVRSDVSSLEKKKVRQEKLLEELENAKAGDESQYPPKLKSLLDKLEDAQKDELVRQYEEIQKRKLSALERVINSKKTATPTTTPPKGVTTQSINPGAAQNININTSSPQSPDYLSDKEMKKVLNRWNGASKKFVDNLTNKSDEDIAKEVKKLRKEIEDLNQGKWPAKILKITDGLKPIYANRIKEEYIFYSENKLFAAKLQWESRNPGNPDMIDVNNPDDALKIKSEVDMKVKEWKRVAEMELDWYRGGNINQEMINEFEVGIPVEVEKYIGSLALDDLIKDKLREEYQKMREETLLEMKNIFDAWKNRSAEESAIKIEGDLDFKIKEAEEEYNKLGPEEKEKCSKGLAYFGYWTSEVRSKAMGKMTGFLASHSGQDNKVAKFFSTFTEKYREDEERSRFAKENSGRNYKTKIAGTAQGFANVMRYGRVAYDIADSFNLRGLNPFRHVTGLLMAVGNTSDVIKRMRLSTDEIKEKTRIETQKDAMEEAERIFKINLNKDGTTNLSRDELVKIYNEQLPQDILERINRGGGISGAGLAQYLFGDDARGKAIRVMDKIGEIEKSKKLNEEEKKAEKEFVFKKYASLLNDLDKMIAHEGAIDNLAYSSRVVEEFGKYAANAFIFDSVLRLANGAYNMHLFDQAWEKGGEATKALKEMIKEKFANTPIAPLDPLDIVPPAPEQSAEAIRNPLTRGEAVILSEALKNENIRKVYESSPREYMEKNWNSFKDIEDSTHVDYKPVANIILDKEQAPVPPRNYESRIEARALAEAETNRAEFENQLKLATIQKGSGSNSIEGVFIKQLSADPEKFGFAGDLEDEEAIKKWAGSRAHIVASENGYFDQKSGMGIRMKGSSIDHNAYVLNMVDGKIAVDEYVNGELRESKVPGSEFEGPTKDDNEYIHREIPRPGMEAQTPHDTSSATLQESEPESRSVRSQTFNAQEIAGARLNTDNPIEINRPENVLATSGLNVSPEVQTTLSNYSNQYGIGLKEMEKVGIKIEDGFDTKESEKLEYLVKHHGNLEKSIEVVNMAENLGSTYDTIGEYYYQLKELEGETDRQNGLLTLLVDHNPKEACALIFGLNIFENQIEIKDKLITLNNVAPKYNLVVVNDGGELKFGLKGPIGENYGNNGRSLTFKPDMALNNENINKIVQQINRLAAK